VVEANARRYPRPKYDFCHLDFHMYKEELAEGDMCILKDVIQHWSVQDINVFLDYLVASKKYKYILICNCCSQSYPNADIATGGWRPLTCNMEPLRKYNATILGKYNTKEVAVIGWDN